MRVKLFKTFTAAAVILAVGHSGLASAENTGAVTLTAPAYSADLYRINCPATTHHVRICVSNAAAGVRAVAAKPGFLPSAFATGVASCSDPAAPTAGSGGVVSPAYGVGDVHILVNKAATGDAAVKTYTLFTRCETAANAKVAAAINTEINN